MHYQSSRQLQDRATSLPIAEVLEAATQFFTRRSGVYSAFVEKRGPQHLVLRGMGGEEIAIAARTEGNHSVVSCGTYLFDAQVAHFLDSLPPAAEEPTVDEPAVASDDPSPAGQQA